MDSPAGSSTPASLRGDVVSVDMGVPDFDPRSLPFDAARELGSLSPRGRRPDTSISARSRSATRMRCSRSTSVDRAPVETLGAGHRRASALSEAGQCRLHGDRRSLGISACGSMSAAPARRLACGTGACAAVAVGRQRGRLDPEVQCERARRRVARKLGRVLANTIWLTGPAEVSFEGHVEV